MRINYPMEHGIVEDWDDMEKLWRYVYSKDQLDVPSEGTERRENPRRPWRAASTCH